MYSGFAENKMELGMDYLNYDPKKALILFDEVLELNENYIDALNAKGLALIRLNKYDDAEKILQKSLKIKETSQAFLNMGQIYKNRKKYEEALNCYNHALKINGKLANIIEILKKEVQEAIILQKRQRLLNNYSKEVKSLVDEGNRYKISEKYWDALNCYERAINVDPSCKSLVKEYVDEINNII